jgi:hypothetical protein
MMMMKMYQSHQARRPNLDFSSGDDLQRKLLLQTCLSSSGGSFSLPDRKINFVSTNYFPHPKPKLNVALRTYI